MSEYNTHLAILLAYYCEAQGLQLADYEDKIAITNDGLPESVSRISKWDLAIKQPSKDELMKLDMAQVRAKALRKQLVRQLGQCKLPVLKSNQIEALANKLEDGMVWFDSDLQKVCYFAKGVVMQLLGGEG